MKKPVIQIIAGHAVTYYPDGYTLTQYEDGELYQVHPFVAEAMERRGWAKLWTPPDPEARPRPEPGPQPVPIEEPPKPEPEPLDEGGKRGKKAR